MATSTDRTAEFLTLSAAASRLSCSPRWLRAARDAGELATYRFGERWERVYWPEVVAWVRTQRVPVTSAPGSDVPVINEKRAM